MPLPVNSRLQCGKYKIIKVLGHGGFGQTYLAEESMKDRYVCIKEFAMPEIETVDTEETRLAANSPLLNASSALSIKRFIKEAHIISGLKHPNIVCIYDVFEENDTAYYAMDYLRGGSLEELVERKGPLSEEEALRYILQVAEALKFAHAKNIMHLDVKPGNILLNDHDQAILIDFGLAKHYDDNGDASTLLLGGLSEGYAPIEQYSPKGANEFSPQIDIYSLGATFYKLLSGKNPPPPIEIMNSGLPSLPSSISSTVADGIFKAMEISSKNRPSNIDEFIAMFTSDSKDNSDSSSIPFDTSDQIKELYNSGKFDELISLLNERIMTGDAVAMLYLGRCYDNGKGVERDFHIANDWYRKAAGEGNAKAMFNLGFNYENGLGCRNFLQDYKKANEWYLKAAEKGNADAMLNLAYNYDEGRGVPQDYQKANEWYLKAAEKGNADAMTKLGIHYGNGYGVSQDFKKANMWYQKGADKGNADAMTNLGYCYNIGRGFLQDNQKANEWYLKAAEKGNVVAMTNLGINYNNGQGVPQDYRKANEWYLKAADLGSAPAMRNLGINYEEGRGVQKDYNVAKEWYLKAADSGDEWSKKKIAAPEEESNVDSDIPNWFSLGMILLIIVVFILILSNS